MNTLTSGSVTLQKTNKAAFGFIARYNNNGNQTTRSYVTIATIVKNQEWAALSHKGNQNRQHSHRKAFFVTEMAKEGTWSSHHIIDVKQWCKKLFYTSGSGACSAFLCVLAFGSVVSIWGKILLLSECSLIGAGRVLSGTELYRNRISSVCTSTEMLKILDKIMFSGSTVQLTPVLQNDV